VESKTETTVRTSRGGLREGVRRGRNRRGRRNRPGLPEIRVREAEKAWERGYRGRADRALALTDSGAEGRHPELGPWNGVLAPATSDDSLEPERVTDTIPSNWDIDTQYGDAAELEDDGTVVFEGSITADDVAGGKTVALVYFAEAPEDADRTGVYSLGPAEATVVTPDVPGDDTNGSLDGDQAVTFGGTDTNTVVGPSTET